MRDMRTRALSLPRSCAMRCRGELELLGVGVLKATPRDDVGVVHDHLGMRDAPGVVVVVDDGHLMVATCACRRASGAASRAEERER